MNKEKIKEILVVICVSYTLITLGIALIESLLAGTDMNFSNLLFKFVCTMIAVCILYTHPLFERLSTLAMIVLQYIAAMLLVFLTVWISGFFAELHEQAYFHIFRSFTAIYAIGAAVYYIGLLLYVKRQNKLLDEIKASTPPTQAED